MPEREDSVRLRHMLDHAREAVFLTQGKTRDDLETERLLNLGLVRLIEIVGEAATKVSGEMCSRHPEIPWTQIRGMRNRLIHGYDFVDFDILWKTVTEELPPLIDALEKIVSQ